jgi:hypothetical protein
MRRRPCSSRSPLAVNEASTQATPAGYATISTGAAVAAEVLRTGMTFSPRLTGERGRYAISATSFPTPCQVRSSSLHTPTRITRAALRIRRTVPGHISLGNDY